MDPITVITPRPRSTRKRGYRRRRRLVILCSLLLASLAVLIGTNWPTLIQSQPEEMVVFVPRTFPSIPHSLIELSVRVRTMMGSGSGVAVGARRIITNYHVVHSLVPGETCWVDLPDGRGGYLPVIGALLARDQARDLAILTIPAENAFKRWARVSKRLLESGEPMLAVTSANGNLPVCTEGYYARRTPEGLFQMTVPAFWGSSGGPVFDASTGELVGLVNRMDRPIEFEKGVVFPPFICYCIPSDWIADFLKELP